MKDDVQRNTEALRTLAAGLLGMVVAMGIGRFAFTPILPLMQRDLGLSNALAGWLAGLNYVGYLAGAIGCSLRPHLLSHRSLFPVALVGSLATTFLMGLTESPFGWGLSRLGGGIASAVLFIAIAAEVTERLGRWGYGHWVGSLYGGIGLGIALSGAAVPLFDSLWSWSGAWIGMGILSLLLSMGTAPLVRRHPQRANPPPSTPAGKERGPIRLLALAYFLEGLGYVVSATFLVAIIAGTPGLAPLAPWSWVAVGVAAIPSTHLWPRLARRLGVRAALILAYGLQTVGILVSALADSIAGVLFASVAFGGTFLGIVALMMAEGQRRSPNDPRRAAALLTACFGIGQMLGPPLAGMLADLHHGFTLPLLFASGAVAAGGFLILLERLRHAPS